MRWQASSSTAESAPSPLCRPANRTRCCGIGSPAGFKSVAPGFRPFARWCSPLTLARRSLGRPSTIPVRRPVFTSPMRRSGVAQARSGPTGTASSTHHRAVTEGRIYVSEEIQGGDVDCDVCVVGSGAGGSVLAHELVTRGLRVLMLEEGGYHTRREFDLTEATAFSKLYQELGNRTTDDLSITILQGRSVGGGTTVNWCSSFRTPRRI